MILEDLGYRTKFNSMQWIEKYKEYIFMSLTEILHNKRLKGMLKTEIKNSIILIHIFPVCVSTLQKKWIKFYKIYCSSSLIMKYNRTIKSYNSAVNDNTSTCHWEWKWFTD